MNSSRKNILFLLLIFIASVLIRLPTLNRPLSKHHEFCTAVALRVIQIWDEVGISKHDFNPIMTYPNPSNRFINNHASGSGKMMDESGNYYYVSHPPLAYYLPYVIFKILGIRPGVLSIQLLNLLVHLFSGVGIFLILKTLLPEQSNLAAILGYAAYMLSAGTLWFHSNVYMADILVQLFFIFGVLFALKSSEKRKYLLLTGTVCFLMTYTSWLGVFFCITLFLLNILKKDFLQALVMASCAAGALLLTAFQYSKIAGWEALREEWLSRFSERSGWASENIIGGIGVVIQNYATSYLPIIVGIILLLILSIKQILHSSGRELKRFIQLSLMPVLLLHLVLFNYSGHDFTTLYGGLFLSVIFGATAHFALQMTNAKWIIIGAIAMFCLSVVQYYYINRPGEYSLTGDRYANFQDIGEFIASQSSDDEVIFLIGMKPSPEVVFYSRRNIKQVRNEAETRSFLGLHKMKDGVIFKIQENSKVELLKRISLE